MTTKITKIATDDETVIVHLQNDGSALQFAAGPKQLAPLLIELHTAYEIEPFTMNEIELDDASQRSLLAILTSMKGVAVTFNTKDETFVASMRNGDTGLDAFGFDISGVRAIATLVSGHGFVSTALENPDCHDTGGLMMIAPTVDRWIEEFRYGFTRRSDEVLAAEMAALIDPHAGGW